MIMCGNIILFLMFSKNEKETFFNYGLIEDMKKKMEFII